MKRKTLIACFLLTVTASLAAAAVPAVVNYQGRLTDNTPQQNPLDATVTMDFSIWDAASGGSSLWTETQSVQVVKGLFNVLLGSSSAMPPTLFSSGEIRYLEIHVTGETLTPRQRIATAPFANAAGRADDAASLGGVGASAYQQRIGTPCPDGYAINAVGADGTATCIQGPQGPAGPPGPAGNGLDTGGIAGTVTTCTGPAAGVVVYVPGRSAVSYSAADGTYDLAFLAAGTYSVQYKTPGTPGSTTVNGIVVSSGLKTNPGPMNVADVTSDVNNCGGCGRACSTNHITPTCSGGGCGGSCATNYANCNGDPADGCEASLRSTDNCGSCGIVCSTNHMTPTCNLNGFCGGTCDSGYSNCDGTFATGCETNINTSNANCGGCNNPCTGGKSCVGGSCV
ncbi:MAG TPA: hypothetical protein VFV19_04185 [Candidatus Polarisedimenticolaceae bacterium]|nr:hypothetical protein [Candidatus Polarisedimenticolaceae bacterium]